MAFTLKINGRPHEVDVDGDTPLSAGLDAEGRPVAWTHRVSGSSVVARYLPPLFKNGYDFDAVEGAAEPPDAFENIRVDYVRVEPQGGPPPSGAVSARPRMFSWWRASSMSWRPRRSRTRSPTARPCWATTRAPSAC